MEPISMMVMMGAGLALQGFGMSRSMSSASAYNQAQTTSIGLEQKVQDQKRQAMMLDARRRSLENLRNTQRARSLALLNATTQGASQGSGLQGGYSQIQGQGAWNQSGITQNLQIGQNIFGLDSQISQQRIAMANAQMGMQQGSAMSSFGSSMMSASSAFGRLGSGSGSGPNPGTSGSVSGANQYAGWA